MYILLFFNIFLILIMVWASSESAKQKSLFNPVFCLNSNTKNMCCASLQNKCFKWYQCQFNWHLEQRHSMFTCECV